METIRLEAESNQVLFLGTLKFPDLFYSRQTRVLNNLHAFSVELLSILNKRNNPNNAYNSEWGAIQIGNIITSVKLSQLKPDSIARILRRKIKPSGFTSRPELDHDLIRMEVLQANLEYELNLLNSRKAAMISWIQVWVLIGILVAVVLTHLLAAPQTYPSPL